MPFSVQTPSGVRLGSCSLVEPSRSLTEEYGVVVGHKLVDASSWSASVLMINPNAEEIVLPCFTCGEPVTGRTGSVQHEILTSDARPVRCGPRRLAPAGLCTEQTCVQEILLGGQIEPSDSPWASPGGPSD